MEKDEAVEKKKKVKPEYNGIEFDSFEEIAFYQWCEEAIEAGLLHNFIYHPPSYSLSTKRTYTKSVQLKTKVRFDEKTLLQPHVYTGDFMLFIDSGDQPDLFPGYMFFGADGEILIDVKGTGSSSDKKTIFKLNQKWLYAKFDVYVNKVIPDDLFIKTWIPEGYRYTEKHGKIKKKFRNTPTIKQYLTGLGEMR